MTQGGAVIDKLMVIKDKHGPGLYDCHQQHQQQHGRLERGRSKFKSTLRYNSPLKPDKL